MPRKIKNWHTAIRKLLQKREDQWRETRLKFPSFATNVLITDFCVKPILRTFISFGVTLTCGIIQNVCPTHVIQIQSKNRKLNFPSTLNQRFVYSQNVDAFSNTQGCSDYKLYAIPSASEHKGYSAHKKNQGRSKYNSRGMGPLPARNLVMLSYLSGMLSPEILNLSQVIPYMIDMELVELKTTNKYNLTKAQIAATMDGNLVALCCSKEDEFPNCLGFGVVRAVDYDTGAIFLITPLERNTLNKVNCLIKGNIALPDSLYYNQGEQITEHVPYMAYTSGRSTSQFAKRDFRTLPVTMREDKK